MANDKEKVLDTAQKYADREQYDKAVKEIERGIDAFKDDCRVLLKLGTYQEKAGQLLEAVRTLVQVSNIYRAEGAYQKALAVLKQAQKIQPKNVDIMIASAELYNVLGLGYEAEEQLQPCLDLLDPVENRDHYGQVIQMLVRVDSENLEIRKKYAQFLLAQNDQEGAVRQYSLALAQLLSKERFVDYVTTAREYLKISPGDTIVIKNLAEMYIRMNRFNDAIAIMQDLEEALRTPEIHELLIKCYMSLHCNRQALEELKSLARKLQAMNARQDKIEDVWLRAQRLDPSDQEVMMALCSDSQILGDSALCIMSSSVLQPIDQLEELVKEADLEDERRRQANKDQTTTNSRSAMGNRTMGRRSAMGFQPVAAQDLAQVLSNEFSNALSAYHSGDIQQAVAMCQHVIAQDETHLPTLRLLSELYESLHDMEAEAQIERKMAKAVFDTDKNESVRHILRAEKCTPNAWENYNLMVFLGFDPQNYGMLPPPMTQSSQFARVPSMQQPAVSRPMPPMQQNGMPGTIPPIPQAPQGIPPIPQRPNAVPPPIPTRGVASIPTFSSPPAPPIPQRMTAQPPSLPMNAPSLAPKSNGSSQFGLKMRKPRPTVEIPVPMQVISNDVLDDLRKLESSRDSSNMPPAMATPINTAASFMAPHSRIPAPKTNANEDANNNAALPFSNTPSGSHKRPNLRTDDPNGRSHLFGEENKEAISDELDDIFDSLCNDEPMIPLKQVTTGIKPVGVVPEVKIPENMRQHVLDSLKEIDFYASIGLTLDANKLLYSLIDEFGDVDVIHAKKIELGLT